MAIGHRGFPVAGLLSWNSFTYIIWDPAVSVDSFRCLLEVILLSNYQFVSTLEVLQQSSLQIYSLCTLLTYW